MWVEVWFWVNGTCLFTRPLSYLLGHIFRFFVSCTGPEEIVPEISRRNSGIIMEKKKKKTGKKKKKVGKFDETCPKKVWARSEKKFFFASEILGYAKAKNREQSSRFNYVQSAVTNSIRVAYNTSTLLQSFIVGYS